MKWTMTRVVVDPLTMMLDYKYDEDTHMSEYPNDFLDAEKVLWKGNPHHPYLRPGLLICGGFGGLVVGVTLCIVCSSLSSGCSVADALCFLVLGLAFGGMFLGYSLFCVLSIMKTEYVITTNYILEIKHFENHIYSYEIESFLRNQPERFGVLGVFPQPLGLRDVKYSTVTCGTLANVSAWKYFYSVKCSDVEKIKTAFADIKGSWRSETDEKIQ